MDKKGDPVPLFTLAKVDGLELKARYNQSELVNLQISQDNFERFGKWKKILDQKITKGSNVLKVLYQKRPKPVWVSVTDFFNVD